KRHNYIMQAEMATDFNKYIPLSLGREEYTKEVQFLRSQNCCVCFVDIVNSTRVTSSINNPEKIRKY
ncbi:MAG: hypothetical protein WB988_20975, partial [Candidatus Nitrosopolaris sp.]